MLENSISLHLALANSLYTNTALNGGYSINKQFEQPKTGYLVSVLDGLVYENISSVNVHELSGFIKDNLNKCSLNAFFGGWKDQTTNKVYFDLSKNVSDLNEALQIAKEKNQLAIWDLNENKEIRVN